MIHQKQETLLFTTKVYLRTGQRINVDPINTKRLNQKNTIDKHTLLQCLWFSYSSDKVYTR